MRTSTIKIQAMTIPYLTDSNGERYWPMRPLCEAIELNWHSQAAKLHPPRYTAREYDVCLPGHPPMKRALCLPHAEFEFWLKGLSSRKVNQYSFHWEMTGDQAILPIQVFSTQDEVWLHFPEHATIPAIFEVDERWDLVQAEDGYTAQLNSEKPLRFHRNSPYIVLKGNPQRLRLRLGHYEAVIWHSPR